MPISNAVTLVIRDLSTGAGRNGLTVYLRHKDDEFTTDQILLEAVTGKQGVYEAHDVPYNEYKLWVNGTEDTSFAGTDSSKGRWLPEGDSVIRLNGASWDADAKKITDLADATAATDAMNRQASDARFVMLDGSNDPDLWVQKAGSSMDGNLLMTGNLVKDLGTPADDNDAATKVYVDDLVDDIEVTPYQESPNEIRLIPGGSTKTGQVYTSWNAAMNYLKSLTPSATKRFVIEVGGVGISGATSIPVTQGGLTDYFENYISIFIKNRFVKLDIADDLMRATTLGMTSIEGGTIYKDDAGANPVFENLHFVNVYFDLTVETVTFTNCKFESCFVKVNDDVDGSATFTTCKGSGNTSNQTLPATIQGWSEIPKDDF